MTLMFKRLFVGISLIPYKKIKSETFLQMKLLGNSIAVEYLAFDILLCSTYPFRDFGN